MPLPVSLATLYKRRVRPVVYPLLRPAALLPLGEPLFHALGLRPRGGRRLDLPALERVLVVRLDLIGDFVFTTPLLRELRRNLPRARITLVTSPRAAPLARACPHVDEVLVFEPHGLAAGARALRFAWRELVPRRFELALLPRFVADEERGTLLAYASGARLRAGFGESPRHGKRTYRGLDRLLTHVLPVRGIRHDRDRCLELLRFVGASVTDVRPEIWTTPADEEAAARRLRELGIAAGDRLVVLVPVTSAPKKDWPLDRYAAVARELVRAGVRVGVVGGRREASLGRELVSTIGEGAVDLLGTPLGETAAIFRRAQLYLGGNTGPVHLAAAVGTPIVEISCHPRSGAPDADSAPARTAPIGSAVTTLQPETPASPCVETCVASVPHCILRVPVERVQEAALRALGTHATRS